jgi:hypothetical protein
LKRAETFHDVLRDDHKSINAMVSRACATYGDYASDEVSNLLLGLTPSKLSGRDDSQGGFGGVKSRGKLGDQRSYSSIRRSIIGCECACTNYLLEYCNIAKRRMN